MSIKKITRIILSFAFITLLFNCSIEGSESSDSNTNTNNGNITFYMNFNELNSFVTSGNRSLQELTISSVTIELSRENYTTQTVNLTVDNNIATGKVNDLDSGYWHIVAKIYDNSDALIYTGETDVQVIAGIDVECNILFDPVITEPTQGGINFTIGINPMPGYKIINQRADKVLMNDKNSKVYMLDSTSSSIGVYSADSMIKEKDIILEQAPKSICFNYDKSAFLLGFSSGRVYSLNIDTEEFTLVADVLMDVEKIISFSETYALVCGPGSWDDEIKTFNIETGQVIDTHNPYDSFGGFIYNELSKTIYTYDTGVSPSDIHYIKVDLTTGEIISQNDSIYHGDYSYGAPVRIINNGSRVITSSGNMFTSTESTDTDLRYAGNIGQSYADLVNDDDNGYIYMINRGSNSYYSSTNVIRKLLVISQETFFLTRSVDMLGDPKNIFQTADHVIVLTENEDKLYSKVFAKSDFKL